MGYLQKGLTRNRFEIKTHNRCAELKIAPQLSACRTTTALLIREKNVIMSLRWAVDYSGARARRAIAPHSDTEADLGWRVGRQRVLDAYHPVLFPGF